MAMLSKFSWQRHLNGENVTGCHRPGQHHSVPWLLTNCSPPKPQLYISTQKTTIKATLTYDQGFVQKVKFYCLPCPVPSSVFILVLVSWFGLCSCQSTGKRVIHDTHQMLRSCNDWIGWSEWLKTTNNQTAVCPSSFSKHDWHKWNFQTWLTHWNRLI